MLARGVKADEILGSRTNQAACSLSSVPPVLAALGRLPELLEPAVEEAATLSRTGLCGHAVAVWRPIGWEGALVTLC